MQVEILCEMNSFYLKIFNITIIPCYETLSAYYVCVHYTYIRVWVYRYMFENSPQVKTTTCPPKNRTPFARREPCWEGPAQRGQRTLAPRGDEVTTSSQWNVSTGAALVENKGTFSTLPTPSANSIRRSQTRTPRS